MNGRNNDLEGWVNDFTSELYSWAFHKVSDAEFAADLVQDTFLAAAEKMESFKGNSSPKTWLFSILNHKIIDYYRKKVNQPPALDKQLFSDFFDADGKWQEMRKPKNWDYAGEEQLLDDPEFHMVFQKCLDALPDQWNTSVKLKYLLEKKGEDICKELGITPSNFWQIIHRAKLQLRECIEKNWFN